MSNTTTLTIPVAPELDRMYVDNGSEGGPFFGVVFKARPDCAPNGILHISVEGTNKARLVRRCLAVLKAGSIRATGYFELERNDDKPDCTHTFVADSFQAVKQKLD